MTRQTSAFNSARKACDELVDQLAAARTGLATNQTLLKRHLSLAITSLETASDRLRRAVSASGPSPD